MGNNLSQSLRVISIIIIPILFSCASTQKEKTESGDAAFYNNRGIAYGAKRQYDQAISDFTKALEINPKDAQNYLYRGLAYRNKGHYDEAISDFTKALEIDPKAQAYFYRGTAYYYRKKYDKSWEDINKAKALGYQIPADFLDSLRRVSGRQK